MTRKCTRCQHSILPGALYRVVRDRQCDNCSATVHGPAWALGKYAIICQDGVQIEWHQRSHWTTDPASWIPGPFLPYDLR